MRILDLTHTIAESHAGLSGHRTTCTEASQQLRKGGFKESLLCLYSRSGRTPDDAPLRAVAFWADSFQRKRKRPKIIRKIFFGR